MAELIRDHNWTESPVGPIDLWPLELLAFVNLMLASREIMTVYWGPDRIMIYNDGYVTQLGERHPMLGRSLREVWPEVAEQVETLIKPAFDTGVASYLDDAPLTILENGLETVRYYTASFEPIWVRSVSGLSVEGVFQIGTNNTERIQAQRRLKASENRFRTLIEHASVGINIGDAKGALTYINPTLLSLIGYTEEEVARGEVRWDQLTPPQYAEADRKALQQLFETGVAQPYEKAYRSKQGRLIPVLIGATMIPAEEGGEAEDIAVFFTDLTRQKKAESALLQTEKLAAVGKLASTIAHEINNPLEAVTNLLFIVRQDPTLSQGSKDYLEVADRELARVSQVTAQTLRFHRQSTAALTVKPESLIDEVLQLYAARLENRKVSVRREYAPNLLVTCYEGDVRQVLNNLVGNAIDAMRTGGRMTVRTHATKQWSTGREGIRMTIADNGPGMSDEVRGQLFKAFFTTKGINGTGLGLWISSRIVHKHRGEIRVYSSDKPHRHGTVFSLWLPLKLADTAREPWNAEVEQL